MKDIGIRFKRFSRNYSPTDPDVEFSRYYNTSNANRTDYDSLVDLIDDTVCILGGIEGMPKNVSPTLKERINLTKGKSEVKIYHFPGQNQYRDIENFLRIEIENMPDCYIVSASFYRFRDSAFYLKLRKALLDIRP